MLVWGCAREISDQKVKRPLQTIDRSGRLTTVTLPILTRSRPRLSGVRFRLTYEDAPPGIFR
jgi:hypothetical protein